LAEDNDDPDTMAHAIELERRALDAHQTGIDRIAG
jgi:hypothetical protein